MIFFYHYNKAATLKVGRPQLTLHFSNACHIVDKLVVSVPTFSHNRKQQPRVVIKGKAKEITIKDKIAFIK